MKQCCPHQTWNMEGLQQRCMVQATHEPHGHPRRKAQKTLEAQKKLEAKAQKRLAAQKKRKRSAEFAAAHQALAQRQYAAQITATQAQAQYMIAPAWQHRDMYYNGAAAEAQTTVGAPAPPPPSHENGFFSVFIYPTVQK